MTDAISSVQQLADAVTEMMPNDKRAKFFLERAGEIVSNNFVREIKVDGDTKEIGAVVGSATQAWKHQYIVTCCLGSTTAADPRFINSCTCPQHEQTGVCKHSIALALTQLPSGAGSATFKGSTAQSRGSARPSTARPAAVVKPTDMAPAEAAAQQPDCSGSQPSSAADAGIPASAATSPPEAGAVAKPPPQAPRPSARQTQGSVSPTQRGTQLTQGGSRKLPASLRRPVASQQASPAKKPTQSQPSRSLQPKLKQALLKRPGATSASRATKAPNAAPAATGLARAQQPGRVVKPAAAVNAGSCGLEPFTMEGGQRYVRMDGSAILQLEGAQLLAQCRKVLAAEEASALREVRALPTVQLPAEQPATQRMSSTAQQAASVAGSPHKSQFTLPPAGSPHKSQFTLPPARDPDATLPVELSEETRQRRAALLSQRGAAKAQTAGAAVSPPAPTEAVADQAGGAQQQTSMGTQQQPVVARKPKLSLVGSLLGPASPPQEPRQPSAAQASQPDSVPEPPAPQPPAVPLASAAQTSAGDSTSGAAKRSQLPIPKKKSLLDVMRG